jgi:hypothetical protein
VTRTLLVEMLGARLERAQADVLVVVFSEADRPLRGAAGHADWRLCGHLSRLVEAGRLDGARGDAALLGVSQALASARLLALGMGPARLAREELRAFAREAATRASGLGFGRVAFALPLGGAAEPPLDTQVVALLDATLHAAPSLRELVLLVPPGTESGLEGVARQWARGHLDLELELGRAGPSPGEVPVRTPRIGAGLPA